MKPESACVRTRAQRNEPPAAENHMEEEEEEEVRPYLSPQTGTRGEEKQCESALGRERERERESVSRQLEFNLERLLSRNNSWTPLLRMQPLFPALLLLLRGPGQYRLTDTKLHLFSFRKKQRTITIFRTRTLTH